MQTIIFFETCPGEKSLSMNKGLWYLVCHLYSGNINDVALHSQEHHRFKGILVILNPTMSQFLFLGMSKNHIALKDTNHLRILFKNIALNTLTKQLKQIKCTVHRGISVYMGRYSRPVNPLSTSAFPLMSKIVWC
jgi:hypothetical protein